MECKNPVHAICGKNPDRLEGFGVSVVCNVCQTRGKKGKNALAVKNNKLVLFHSSRCKGLSFDVLIPHFFLNLFVQTSNSK